MIPGTVKIGGRVYNVTYAEEACEDNPKVDGKILYGKRELRLKSGMDSEYTKEILLHEIMHGVFDFCGLEQDENVIDRLSQALYQVLKDNNLKFGEDTECTTR